MARVKSGLASSVTYIAAGCTYGLCFTPTYAVSIATLSVYLFSLVSRTPMGYSKVLAALASATENSAKTAVLLVTIGVLINCISISSLGVTFSLMINEWAGSNLMLLLVLIALASLIVGMGLPVTASYIVLATLSAPALYGLISQSALVEVIVNGQLNDTANMMMQMMAPSLSEIYNLPTTSANEVMTILAGLPPEAIEIIRSNQFDASHLAMMLLSAHMIIFWLSQDSNVTPPVCLVAFTAAGIAKTPPMATGVEAWKTAKALYIVPLLFAYTPFIGGTHVEVMQIFFYCPHRYLCTGCCNLWICRVSIEAMDKRSYCDCWRVVSMATSNVLSRHWCSNDGDFLDCNASLGG